MTQTRLRGARGVGGILLLTLLAVCGYIGTRQENVQTVSVAVTRQSYPLEEFTVDSVQDAAMRLQLERDEELSLLREVAQNSGADVQTKADALAQMADIAERMEYEAQVDACLAQMGLNDAHAVCGAQMMTIMLPYASDVDDAQKVRVIDAVCSLTGFDAGDIKIIITKK